jgi:hypothetical protein
MDRKDIEDLERALLAEPNFDLRTPEGGGGYPRDILDMDKDELTRVVDAYKQYKRDERERARSDSASHAARK